MTFRVAASHARGTWGAGEARTFPRRFPPTKSGYLRRTQARLGGEEWRSGSRLAATCSSVRGGRVVYGRVHIHGTGGRVDAPTLGRYFEPRFFLDGVPAVIVRLAGA